MLSIFKKSKIEEEVKPKPIWLLKEYLKDTAIKLREAKNAIKESQRKGGVPKYELYGNVFTLRHAFRHHHIAYCEIRGKSRKVIENPAPTHLPNEKLISEIKQQYYIPVRDSWLQPSVVSRNVG